MHTISHTEQVSLVLSEPERVDLRGFKQDAYDLGGMLGELLVDGGIDGVTDLLLHLRSDLLRWHLLRGLLGLTAAHRWEVVALHHGAGLVSTLVLATLSLIVEVLAATVLVVPTSLLALVHIVEILGRVQELLHLAPLLLLSLLGQLFRRLPELNLHQTRTENVGLVELLDSLLGGIYVGVENKVLNVSGVKLLTSSFL